MCFGIVRFVGSVASLDKLCSERAKGGTGTREVFLEEGVGEYYLYAVEEDPAKKESSYLATRIGI